MSLSRKRLAARVHVTPGVALITSLLVKVSLPSYLLYHTVEHCWPTIDSHLGWGCYSVLGSLVLLSLHIFVTYLHSVYCLYRARALGARPIPSVNGRWPGNFDLLREWLGIWKNGYPGDIAGRIMHRLESNTYHVKMFWRDTVFTADPEIVREMLTTDHANYVKGRDLTNAMGSVLGSGVFNTNGDLWRFHRNMSRPFFTRGRLSKMVPAFVKHADKTLDRLDRYHRESNNAAVDVQDLASKFTLDAATDYLFGNCVNSIDELLPRPGNATPVANDNGNGVSPPSKPSNDSILPITSSDNSSLPLNSFPTAFSSALHTLASRLRSGALWPLKEVWKDSTKKDVSIIRSFVQDIVARALDRREKRDKKALGLSEKGTSDAEEEDDKGDILLDHLINMSDDIELIQDELINILIAGRDTTAACITFATYLLSQHPEALEQLRKEVESVLSTVTSASPVDEHQQQQQSQPTLRAPTMEDLRQMPYLRAVINETLRLFPSVPMNVRDSVSERVWVAKDGARWYLPAGTSITYSLLHIHRSPALWGPTSQQFDPSRFLPSDPRYQAYYASKPFVFMPFNAGPRSCLGQQFAYAEVGVFICRLIQRWTSSSLSGNSRTKGWWLDTEAIPEGARVPLSWNPASSPSKRPSATATAKAKEGEGLPTHSTETLSPLSSDGTSPRRAVEKVWPKSHLTMFVEGGLWIRFTPSS